MDKGINSTLKVQYVIDEQKWTSLKVKLKEKTFEAVKATLGYIGYFNLLINCKLTVMLGNDHALKELNLRFRGKDKPTNVLSFPEFDLKEGDLTPLMTDNRALLTLAGERLPLLKKKNTVKFLYIGDIAVSFDSVYNESQEQSKKFMDHYIHLIVHSVLHLLGYDHIKAIQAKRMEKLETKILAQLGIGNPYKT